MALKKENFDLLDIAKSQVVNFQKGWNKNARESALARLINMGLPNHRDEYWKYTNPGDLISGNVSVPSVKNLEDANSFPEINALKIVFCDGIFNSELSDDLTTENISISRLSDAEDLHWAQNYYGTLEKQGKYL